MVKRLKLGTRALGAEPNVPEVPALATWIAAHRGTPADIITCQIDRSLTPQLSAGITSPCAGGRFYRGRIMASMQGIEDGKAIAEISLNPCEIIQDAVGVVAQKKGAWCALPAPHVLGISDAFYNDEEEWNDALTGFYRMLMRSMRDAGITGHVLICTTLEIPEIVSLVRQNVFFFLQDPDRDDLATLMEYQRQVAVGRDGLDTLLDLTSEYDIRKIILVDADSASINHALSCFDPDQIIVGGYCTDKCDDYWKNLVTAATYTV